MTDTAQVLRALSQKRGSREVIKKGSPEWQERHEQRLAIMREKFQRNPPRLKFTKRSYGKGTRPQDALTPQQLAHAIRIAAKMAAENRDPNPLFIEALETAATFFDEIVENEKPST